MEDTSGPWMEHFAHEEARDQQGQFMADAYSSLVKGRTIIAEAPTGLGKTAASLASALAAMKQSESVKNSIPDRKAKPTQDCHRYDTQIE